MSTDSMRCPSASSWTALAVSPPSAPMTWLSTIVLNRNASPSAARSGRGRSVTSSKPWASGRCAPARTCPERYAGSPRAVSHAASDAESTSLIAGREPASGSSVTASEDQEGVVQERQESGQRSGDVCPRGSLEDLTSAGLSLRGHAQAVDEGEGLARCADLDRQRREREHHSGPEADEADDGEAGHLEDEAGDHQPGCDAGAEL